MEEKVKEAQAKADLGIELIGDLMGDQARQDFNVVPRLEKIEKQQLLCKLREELKELKGGEKMTIYENDKPTNTAEYDKKDLNKDGKVTPFESNVYDFFQGVLNAQQHFFQGVIENTQKHSLWTNLGSMVFLLAVVIFSIFIK